MAVWIILQFADEICVKLRYNTFFNLFILLKNLLLFWPDTKNTNLDAKFSEVDL